MKITEQIDELLALAAKATPGPWESTADPSDPRGDRSDWIITSTERVVIRESRSWFWNDPPRTDEVDHALIASLRNRTPALLRVLRIALNAINQILEDCPVSSNCRHAACRIARAAIREAEEQS